MFETNLKLPVIHQEVGDSLYLSEVLGFPELSRLGTSTARNRRLLSLELLRWIEERPVDKRLDLQRRWVIGEIEQGTVEITLDPPQRSTAWQTPVQLELASIVRRIGDEYRVTFLPAIGIEVIQTGAETTTESQALPASELKQRSSLIEAQARMILARKKALASLKEAIQLQPIGSVNLDELELQLVWDSLKTLAKKEFEGTEEERLILPKVATNLRKRIGEPVYLYEDQADKLARALETRGARSILLVGESGVGKTAIVRKVAGTMYPGLAKRPIWSTNGAQLVAGTQGFGVWQERCQQVWRECAKTNAILHVGSLVELMDVGKCEGNDQGVGSFLRPYISRGDLLVIAECTPTQLAMIEQQDSGLLAAFEQKEVETPAPEVELEILKQCAARESKRLVDASAKLAVKVEAKQRSKSLKSPREAGRQVDEEALATLGKLHHLYATYSAAPGRAMRFLRNRMRDHDLFETPVTPKEVIDRFAEETGLPSWLLNDDERFDYEQAKLWFEQRVIGQSNAVTVVIDLLAKLKAGLQRRQRPLGNLMFIGPTGVGKTEMAKALATYLFGSATRLIRIDMSEYADPYSVQRLIAGSFEKEGVLTSQVREQPFSVILLDEFEKAHPQFFDLLLQVLGEGRLTDRFGRRADFQNSVIIMTSNLGAESFQKGKMHLVKEDAIVAARQHFTQVVRKWIRPELYNRIDHIVPFDILSHSVAEKILAREFELFRELDGVKFRKFELNFDPTLADELMRNGFDPAFGARSVKRAIQQTLTIPLAHKLVEHPSSTPLEITAKTSQESTQIDARRVPDRDRTVNSDQEVSLICLVESIQDLRLDWQRLQRSTHVQRIRDQAFRLERFEKKVLRRDRFRPHELEQLRLLATVRGLLETIDKIGPPIADFEENCLLNLYQRESESGLNAGNIDLNQGVAVRDRGEQELSEAYMRVHAWEIANRDSISLLLLGTKMPLVWEMVDWYERIAVQMNGACRTWVLQDRVGKETKVLEEDWNHNMEWRRASVGNVDSAWRNHDIWDWKHRDLRNTDIHFRRTAINERSENVRSLKSVVGCFLELSGDLIRPRLETESGIHEFHRDSTGKAFVRVQSVEPLESWVPPIDTGHFLHMETKARRRIYHEASGAITDTQLDEIARFSRTNMTEVVMELCKKWHTTRARNLGEMNQQESSAGTPVVITN